MPEGVKIEELSIGICGGGLAGLATALICQQNGMTNVKVYERDRHFNDRRQGYGLTLTNNGKGPLAKLGILDECIARDCPSNSHWVFSPSGAIKGYFGRAFDSIGEERDAEQKQKSKEGEEEGTDAAPAAAAPSNSSTTDTNSHHGNLRIPRQDLRRMLLDRLQPGTVVWGHKLLDYEEGEDDVLATFSDCSKGDDKGEEVVRQVRCEVLVGADGVRSRVRQLRDAKKFTLKQAAPNHPQQPGGNDNPQQLSPTPLTFLGVNVIIGISPARHPLLEKQGFYVLDGQHRLFTMPFRAGQHGGNYNPPGGNNNPFRAGAGGSGGTGADKIMDEEAESRTGTATATGEVMMTPTTTSTSTGIAAGGEGQPLHMWQLSFSGWTEREFQDRVLLPPDGDIDGDGDDDGDGDGGEYSIPTATHSADTSSSSTNRKAKVNAGTTAPGLGRRLLREASRRTAGWMSPVQELISLTRPGDVWGTPLYDRDPMWLLDRSSSSSGSSSSNVKGSRVTLMGDACHPMSMFKGQGANQALEDGPLLAYWLLGGPAAQREKAGLTVSRKTLLNRLRNFERQMVARSSAKQRDSRAAAHKLHSVVTGTDTGTDAAASTAAMSEKKRRKGEGKERNPGDATPTPESSSEPSSAPAPADFLSVAGFGFEGLAKEYRLRNGSSSSSSSSSNSTSTGTDKRGDGNSGNSGKAKATAGPDTPHSAAETVLRLLRLLEERGVGAAMARATAADTGALEEGVAQCIRELRTHEQ